MSVTSEDTRLLRVVEETAERLRESREDLRLLMVQEAAERLRLSRSKIYLLMEQGELEYCLIGRSRRIPVSEVERLIRECMVTNGASENGREAANAEP